MITILGVPDILRSVRDQLPVWSGLSKLHIDGEALAQLVTLSISSSVIATLAADCRLDGLVPDGVMREEISECLAVRTGLRGAYGRAWRNFLRHSDPWEMSPRSIAPLLGGRTAQNRADVYAIYTIIVEFAYVRYERLCNRLAAMALNGDLALSNTLFESLGAMASVGAASSGSPTTSEPPADSNLSPAQTESPQDRPSENTSGTAGAAKPARREAPRREAARARKQSASGSAKSRPASSQSEGSDAIHPQPSVADGRARA